MVFQKKANRGGKQNQRTTPMKKPVKMEEASDIFDDFDDDMDSDGSDEVPRTPANKTPKGKQSLSEKRVSFQVSGKNTPGKTPAKNTPGTPKPNSAVKKQATPGKVGGLQQFQGMKKNQKQNAKQQQQDDDDDDDEDEDDSDFDGDDLDLDLEDDDDDEAAADEDDDDDDDDEEEDDEDDDDDDDDDDEEEDEKMQTKPQTPAKTKVEKISAKQTPVKSEKLKAASPKKEVTQSPASAKKQKPTKGNISLVDEEERRRQRNITQLYVGSLPKETTVEELKALSPDILYCYLPRRNTASHVYAFLQFESEEKVEENFEKLQNKKFKGQFLTLDYVGEKSKNKKVDDDGKKQYHNKKLFISGLPVDATIHQVAKYFPKCYQITFNPSPAYRTASVFFWEAEDCNAAFDENKEIKINGVKISVLHALLHKHKLNKKKRSRNVKKNGMQKGVPPAKKMKYEAKEEESSDDE